MKTEFFALRHKETGAFMPLLPGNRGYSHWEPGDEGTGVVRLFPTANAATIASSTWARGTFNVEYPSLPSLSGPVLVYDGSPELHVEPVAGRYKGQLEVVVAHVVLGHAG